MFWWKRKCPKTAGWNDFLRQAIYEQDHEMILSALAAGPVLEYALYEGDLDLMGEALAAGADPGLDGDDTAQ
ncbi:MAG: hypothetical protein JWQ02_4620 [Capsulimonas sp.]|nr:hypothetical protein [Capsulimonas sp.]